MSIFSADYYSTLKPDNPNYQLVVEKRRQMGEIFKRYDSDKKLAILDPYKMLNRDGQPTPDVINVTMNEAMVFWNKCASIMNGANMQRIVYGKNLSDNETTTIETFYDDIYYMNDLMLANALFISLYGFLIEQILIRGAIAARILLRMDGDRFIPEIMPFDVRYFLYETDSQGLIWGAYDVTRTKAQILRDYGITIRSAYAVVTDFWDHEVNEIFIAGIPYKGGSQTSDPVKFIERPRDHGLDDIPLVYQKSGAGLQSFQDAGIIKYQGESIFAPNRGLIPELHRAASIFMTLTDLAFEGALVANLEEPNEGPPLDNPYGRRKITELGINEKLSEVPVADIKYGSRLLINMLAGALQRGGLPNIDYGSLSFPLSAVAIKNLQGQRDAIFIPRLNALSYFYREASLKIKKQYIQAGYHVPLGEEGFEREYSTADIDKKFATKYEFHSSSPMLDIANTAVGQQQMAMGISRHTVYADTLKLNDPDGEINKGRDERAEAGDMAITLHRRLRSLADKDGNFDEKTGKDIEAELILQQLETIARARVMGNPMGLSPKRGGVGADMNIKPLVSLMDGGSARAPGPMEEEGEAMPSVEEAENRNQRREEVAANSRAEA